MIVYRNGKILLIATKKFGLYRLDGACCNVASANMTTNIATLHLRTGHISSKSLLELHKPRIAW